MRRTSIVRNLRRVIKALLGLFAFMVFGRRLIGNIISDGQRYWIHKFNSRSSSEARSLSEARPLSELSSEGLKLHLGCGRIILQGFINIDLGDISDLKHLEDATTKVIGGYDLTYGIGLPNDCCKFIYSSHFLEHLDVFQGLKLLKECYRVLMPGGNLRIAIPDIANACRLYSIGGIKEKIMSHPRWEDIYKVIPHALQKLEDTDFLNFFVYDTGGPGGHKAIYDEKNLVATLTEVEFSAVTMSEYQECIDMSFHKGFSLYVSATK